MKITQVITEFHNKDFNSKCGIYEIEISGDKGILIRNNNSVGVIAFYRGEPASQCVTEVTDKVKQDFFSLLGE